jgi:hypothetical protein
MYLPICPLYRKTPLYRITPRAFVAGLKTFIEGLMPSTRVAAEIDRGSVTLANFTHLDPIRSSCTRSESEMRATAKIGESL